jgi:K+ transporter
LTNLYADVRILIGSVKRWRRTLFIAMARNASISVTHFRLPSDRTVMMGSQVAL